MAKIAFILLCHKDVPGIIAQARRLTAAGDYVAIHFDARADGATYALLRRELADEPSVVFARRRHKCGWGEWSLVAATLEAVRAAMRAFGDATHFYMLSGDCMPIKTAGYAHDFLDGSDCDYIEHNDFFESDWIKTGLREERLVYRFWFNERTQAKRFYAMLALQQKLGIRREIPPDLTMMIGSQWWCLRRETIRRVLELCSERRDVMRFFATTWIPDETFFQTLVPHLVARDELRNRTLTHLIFTDYGMPVTFYNDQYDLLLRQDYLFARKISPEALELRQRLGDLWASRDFDVHLSNEGKSLHRFLTGKGRVGRRFVPRFWDSESSFGRGRKLLVVVAKKWHVAKRLTAAIRDHTDIPAVDYLFNEDFAHLPDMGGVETDVIKREHHRKAVLKLLFDQFQSEQLVICVDPSALSLLQDFQSDRAEMRVLQIDATFDDDYIRGHIQRVGLAGPSPDGDLLARLLPVMRSELEYESDLVRDMEFNRYFAISPAMSHEEDAHILADFLDIPPDLAQILSSEAELDRD